MKCILLLGNRATRKLPLYFAHTVLSSHRNTTHKLQMEISSAVGLPGAKQLRIERPIDYPTAFTAPEHIDHPEQIILSTARALHTRLRHSLASRPLSHSNQKSKALSKICALLHIQKQLVSPTTSRVSITPRMAFPHPKSRGSALSPPSPSSFPPDLFLMS